MGVLDHWHPVLSVQSLAQGPKRVRLAGREIALFQGEDGKIGAVEDQCIHRRARLSLGKVVGNHLQCPYHGWEFDADGEAKSPGTPRMRACATSYDTCHQQGYVWIRSRTGTGSMPRFEADGYVPICSVAYDVNAPLEVVLDNFTEVEHTPTTHANLGYALSGMSRVVTDIETGDDWVRVVNRGPQKWTPWAFATLGGFFPGDTFTDDWTTHFSPVYAVYDQYWTHPKTDAERRDRYRIYVFFNPLDDKTTQLVVFGFQKAISRLHGVILRLARPVITRFLDTEIQCDMRLLESLADKSPELEGMKLSRFDRVLGMHRERIERIYRGRPGARSAA